MIKMTMKAFKYDGCLHYESPMELIEKKENRVVLFGHPNRSLVHHTRGEVFTFEKPSIEFYFTDRWYTVACVVDLTGLIEFFYCNIAMPCKFREDEVNFVDLDLDMIVQKDFTYKIVDQDEFLVHQKKYRYGSDLIKKAEDAVETLIDDLTEGRYPFDGAVDGWINTLGL